MKILAAILLTFSLAAPLCAQLPLKTLQSPGIDLTDFIWGVRKRTTYHQAPGYSAETSTPREDRSRKESVSDIERSREGGLGGPPGGDSARSRPPYVRQKNVEQTVTRLETIARVKNLGNKRIKRISWSYVFFADPNYREEVKRYAFRSKTDISPGEEKDLIKQVVDPAPTDYQKVIIDRVEYSDGSKWQRPVG